jgi:hypothetical protein
MSEMKKVTAFLPADLLATCQNMTGEGVTETLRQALEAMARKRAYAGLLEMRGKIKFEGFDLDALREDREFDEHGNVTN